jgi:transposase InsO family protein
MPAVKPRVVTARSPNHVWHIDLTVVPTAGGFWVSWLPFTLPQQWPFCWWVAVIVDQFSRRVMGIGAFAKPPTSKAIWDFLGCTISSSCAQPKHLICDKGRQFWCHGFKRWCRRRDIRLRYGAVGRHGSIALIERFVRTLKDSLVRDRAMPLQAHAFRRELCDFADWFNELRPHTALSGRTPNEVYQRRFPAARRPRYEPRRAWPRGSSCARPWALARHNPGAPLELELAFHGGRRHLPIVTLKRAA